MDPSYLCIIAFKSWTIPKPHKFMAMFPGSEHIATTGKSRTKQKVHQATDAGETHSTTKSQVRGPCSIPGGIY